MQTILLQLDFKDKHKALLTYDTMHSYLIIISR